jgi:hypothetical protein
MSRQRLMQINKDRKADAEYRRARVLKLSMMGKSASEIAGVEGIAVQTVYNNLSLARKETSIKAAEVREEIDADLLMLRQFALDSEEMTDAEIVSAVRGCGQDRARLFGADAPSRSESVNITANAENLERFRAILQACSGLDETQFQQGLDALRAIPRVVQALPEPPETSPLWGDQKKLGDGDAIE